MIDGVVITALRQIVDERGKVMRMLRADDTDFEGFGEIYFSVVNPGVVKAWKKHHRMIQRFAVPVGKIKLVIYDDRQYSPTVGKFQTVEMGEDNYCLVRIPPQVFYGFQGISSSAALIANCTDRGHDPQEIERREPFDERFPYRWKNKVDA